MKLFFGNIAALKCFNSIWLLIAIILLLNNGCKSDSKLKPTTLLNTKRHFGQTLFENLSPNTTNVHFRNDVFEDSTYNEESYPYWIIGGGTAIGDLNNDGLPEILFTANNNGLFLYKNLGDLKFEDITQNAGIVNDSGWYSGISLVDVNNDGWLDIYVCKAGPYSFMQRQNKLYINKGNFTFTEEAEFWGLNDSLPSIHAAFFDFDNDGDLDCYIINHPTNFKDIFNVYAFKNAKQQMSDGADRLLENRNGKFVDVSKIVGLDSTYGFGLSVSIIDINNDGFEDIYVANDYIGNDYLLLNQGGRFFKESTSKYFKHTSLFAMGSNFNDLNNDAREELMVVDMKPDNHPRNKNNFLAFHNEFYYHINPNFSPSQFVKNVLQTPTDTGAYAEVSQMSGVDKTDWSWNVILEDLDNDGLKDIHVTNGVQRDASYLDFFLLEDSLKSKKYAHNPKLFYLDMPKTYLPDYAYKNVGNLIFDDVSALWGIDLQSISNGAACGDLDGDGDLDLVINNLDDFAFVLKNNTNKFSVERNFLRIALSQSNTFTTIGSKVIIHYDNTQQYNRLQPVRGYQSSQEPVIHFGLGKVKQIDSVEVFWKSGKYSVFKNIKANQLITLSDSSALAKPPLKSMLPPKTLAQKKLLPFLHQENDFIDFKRDRCIPFRYSKNGPGAAVADVNADGLDDILFTNGSGASPKLFLQKKDGTFTTDSIKNNFNAVFGESLGAVFFDADGDGDDDLYIATGSNEHAENSPQLADYFYLNNGKGQFVLTNNRIPQQLYSNSFVIAADFDKDGDIDLLVGGSSTSGKYPLCQKTTLLQNNKGFFTDVTSTLAPGLDTIGITSAAVLSDIDNDGWLDILIAGEWMPLTIFKNKGGRFTNISANTSVQNLKGLWKSIAAIDVDNDGDMDYVVGNLGLNAFLKASVKEPLEILYADFDKNKVFEPLLFHYLKNERAPFIDRMVFLEQMPKMKNIFLTFNQFATYDWDAFFKKEKRNARYYSITELASGVFINQGGGKFTFAPLPDLAQIAPVFGTQVFDFNDDGFADILLQGNWHANYYTLPEFDAGRGLLLLGKGDGSFKTATYNQSGFFNQDDARGIALLNTSGNEPCFVAATNSSSALTFKFNKSAFMAVQLTADEHTVIYKYINGKQQRSEPQNTSGYLAQSSRTVYLSKGVKQVKIIGSKGERVVFNR